MIRLSVALVPVLCLSSLPACAPDAHSTEAPPAAEQELEPAVVTLFGERVLLFMEHPQLVAGEPARFLAHFSVLATGDPVRSGRVELAIGDTHLAVEQPKRDGLFTPEGPFPKAGRFSARITLTSDQADETLDLGFVTVHASPAHASTAALAEVSGEPADAVPFLMEQQWKIGLLLAEAAPRQLVERLVVPGQVVAAEGAAANVAAPAAGRLLAPSAGNFPHSGEQVQAGQELALVEPPLSAADAAQLRSLDLQWNLEALAVERSFSAAKAHLLFAEREHARLTELRRSGLSTQQQLEQAERDLSLAQGQLASALSARDTLEDLRARRERDAWSVEGSLRVRMLAPIAGELVSTGRVLGEAVEAGDPVFRVVDRSRLWIEGRLSEFDLPLLASAEGALASFPGLPGTRRVVAPIGTGELFQRSPEVDPVTRTLRLRVALPSPGDNMRPGMLAELQIAVASVEAAVVIPAEAVVLDQGLPTAYVMLNGETFQRRDLVLGLGDGDLVEVRAGLQPGERVATRGATTIRMASLSPSSFGHGHAH